MIRMFQRKPKFLEVHEAFVEAVGDFSNLESVIVAGTATTVVDGKIRVK